MAYTKYAQIDIDHTKVSANESNFPIVFSGTYDGTGGEADIRTVANGGNVENTASGGASGSLTVSADLVFSPNSDGSSPYDFEIEKYSASTGEIVAHVEITSLSSSADTTIYMCYSDSSVTTSQENVTGVWDANYVGVWHLSEGSGLTAYDSTSNNNDGTFQGNLPDTGRGGQIGDGQDHDGTGDYISLPNLGFLGDDTITIEILHNSDTWQDASNYFGFGTTGTNNYVCSIRMGELGKNIAYKFYFWGNDLGIPDSTLGDFTGSYVHTVARYDASASSRHIYHNGSSVGNDTPSNANFQNNSYRIGGFNDEWVDGIIDDVRVSDIARDGGWISTTYNNQSQADQGENSTFFSLIGSEVDVGVISAPMLSAGF